MIATAGWRGSVQRTIADRFQRGFPGEQLGTAISVEPFYPWKWNEGWIAVGVSFALQMAAGILQLIWN